MKYKKVEIYPNKELGVHGLFGYEDYNSFMGDIKKDEYMRMRVLSKLLATMIGVQFGNTPDLVPEGFKVGSFAFKLMLEGLIGLSFETPENIIKYLNSNLSDEDLLIIETKLDMCLMVSEVGEHHA